MTRCMARPRALIGALAAMAGLATAAQLASQPQAPAQNRPLQDLRVRAGEVQELKRQVAQPQQAEPLAQAAEIRIGPPPGRRAGL